MLNETIIKERVKKVAAQLTPAGLDGLLITHPANVSYLTGFQGQDSWCLLLGRRAWLLTDSRYTEQARQECFGCQIVQRKNSLAEEAGRIMARQRDPGLLGLDAKTTLLVQQAIRKQVKARLKPVTGLVETVRSVKEPGEQALIRRAIAINQAALAAALGQLRIGMTENELAGILELEIRRRNGHVGFETIVCFGPNGSRNHHTPGPRTLRQSDVMLIDFGTALANYRCDMTRCFGVNRVTREYARAYQAVAAAQAAAIAAMKAGATLGLVDRAARQEIDRAGFPVYGHGSGHGIGLDIHELPFLGRNQKETLRANQIVTIEPGVYLPGKWGIRIEDDVLITENGARVLSADRLPSTLTILQVK